MAFLSMDEYVADGVTQQFDLAFPYLLKAHIKVYVEGIEDTTFTWVNDGRIELTAMPDDQARVLIERHTSRTSSLVNFTPGTLTEADLDNARLQAFYMAQEALDRASRSVLLGLPVGVANKFLRWDPTATAIENADVATLGAVGIPVPVSQGGTGSADAANARTQLGVTLENAGASTFGASVAAAADAPAARVLLNAGALELGQCRFDYVSTTVCRLTRFNGKWLFIDGAWHAIPAAGVELSNSGLTSVTWYYIYAYMDAGVMTLEASTTARATDTTYGHQIQSGDSSRTLVGAVQISGGGIFYQVPEGSYVLSWFNRRPRQVSASCSQASTGLGEWQYAPGGATFWISWSDVLPLVQFHARVRSSNDGSVAWAGVGDESDNTTLGALGGNVGSTNGDICAAGSTTRVVSEGSTYISRLRYYGNPNYTTTIYGSSKVTVTIWG